MGVNNTVYIINILIKMTKYNHFLKGCFFVLWRNIFCAISAPGQPHSKDNKCKVRSFVRHFDLRAADLSMAKAQKVTRLMIMYKKSILTETRAIK